MSFKYAMFSTPLEHLFAALYLSNGWHDAWLRHKSSRHKHFRQLATFGRARAVILFDRVLNGEMR